jgi:tRNA G18 (ribose-2'-O)-methylase SpoU
LGELVKYTQRVRGNMELLYGVHPVLCALRSKSRRMLGGVWMLESMIEEAKAGKDGPAARIVAAAEESGVKVKASNRQALHTMLQQSERVRLSGAPPPNAQGVVLECSAISVQEKEERGKGRVWDVEQVDEGGGMWRTWGFAAALDGISDPHNVGSILRSAHLLGVDSVLLGTRHGAKPTPAVSKASSGALELLLSERRVHGVDRLDRVLTAMRADGFATVALSGDGKSSTSLSEWAESDARRSARGVVVVLGSEGEGLRPLVLRACEHRVRIDMPRSSDLVDSLNVGVAAGIVFHALQRNRAS